MRVWCELNKLTLSGDLGEGECLDQVKGLARGQPSGGVRGKKLLEVREGFKIFVEKINEKCNSLKFLKIEQIP